MDTQQVLTALQFGRVDAETDYRIEQCFIGTEMLRQVLQPQHSLLVGNKGSGKSAIFKLLCDDLKKVRPLLPKNYQEIFSIPVYGMQTEEYIGGGELRELNPQSVDDFRHFWLLYLGLKAAARITQNERLKQIIEQKQNEKLTYSFASLNRIVNELGLIQEHEIPSGLKQRLNTWLTSTPQESAGTPTVNVNQLLTVNFQQKAGISILGLLDMIDLILRETNCAAWMLLDKLDLLFVGDYERLKTAVTALVQLLVEYSNRFKNIHFKVFLRTDIYQSLRIVNKSHLVSYTSEMKWRDSLLIKMLVSRAVADPNVKAYCESVTKEQIDVTNIIVGSDEYVRKIFYTIFEPSMSKGSSESAKPNTIEWLLKRLEDGTGSFYPREFIHLGNLAVEKQREINRLKGQHCSTSLISPLALKQAYEMVSAYRCDTYLYSEFPNLVKHFDVFRGSESATFHREELYMLFEPLTPKGDDAIRAVYYAGLIQPVSGNVDSSKRFRVPLLYKSGLGITEKKARKPQPRDNRQQPLEHQATTTVVNW